MQKSETIAKLAEALSKAQAKIEGAVKDAQNPFFKSKYADLASVMEAIRKPFADNGLSYVQMSRVTEAGNLVLVTILMHSAGEWVSGEYPINPVKADPQGMGSAITYARRYALSAMAGVAQIDDDGEFAMARPQQPTQQKAYPRPAPAPQSGPRGNNPKPASGYDPLKGDFNT